MRNDCSKRRRWHSRPASWTTRRYCFVPSRDLRTSSWYISRADRSTDGKQSQSRTTKRLLFEPGSFVVAEIDTNWYWLHNGRYPPTTTRRPTSVDVSMPDWSWSACEIAASRHQIVATINILRPLRRRQWILDRARPPDYSRLALYILFALNLWFNCLLTYFGFTLFTC